MKNKLLMCVLLAGATVELGAVPVKTAIYNYFRKYVPGRKKRVLNDSSCIKTHGQTESGDPAEIWVSGNGEGGHSVHKSRRGIKISAIKDWEYLELNDSSGIEGKYIVYDTKNKKHICIKNLSDYPYILNPGRWAAGILITVTGAVILVFTQKN